MKDNILVFLSKKYVVKLVLPFFLESPCYDASIHKIKTDEDLILFAENEFAKNYVSWAYAKIFNIQPGWPPWLRTRYLIEAYSVFIDRMLFEWKMVSKNKKNRPGKPNLRLVSTKRGTARRQLGGQHS